MTSNATTPHEYLNALPEDRKKYVTKLFEVVKAHLPQGFEAGMSYGMLAFYVPKALYEPGYHVGKVWSPLHFINIASQKNFVSLYHSGIYASTDLLNWFTGVYPMYTKQKLDMGKSCIRFKKPAEIPFELIAELCEKMTVNEWIEIYEKAIKK